MPMIFNVSNVLSNNIRFSLCGSVVADKHGYSGGCDDDIAQPAEGIGDLTENEIAQDCRENDLTVIVDRNFSCGGEGVGGGDGELTTGGRQTCQQQDAKLCQGHGMEVEDQVGQGAGAGKCGEEEHDKRPFYTADAHGAHIGISHTCHQSAHQPDQSGQTCQIGWRGFDDEEGAEEGSYDANPLKEIDFFFQNQDAEEDGKERRHLIQHRCICQYQMVNGIEIAEDADGAAEGTEEQELFRGSVQFDFGAFLHQNE